MLNAKSLKIRPYARLLTMLGEQLIQNERIALIELIKNSYDADSKWVRIQFENFDSNYGFKNDSVIIIEDDGIGMTQSIIEKHWINPATPEKLIRKKKNPITKKGRIIQGEKGIGRFAILKLGRKVKIITKKKNEDIEYVVEYDFSKYDDEFLSENGKEKELYIDDLNVSLSFRDPEIFINRKVKFGTALVDLPDQGTRIEISNLKGSWSDNKVKMVFEDVVKLESIFDENPMKSEFNVKIYRNGEYEKFKDDYLEKLLILLENKAVFRIVEGQFDHIARSYNFKMNGNKYSLSLDDPNIKGLNVFKKYFAKDDANLDKSDLECGPFEFGFYIFDFDVNALSKYRLDREDKKIIENHRIYLYRDNIRVYPYGEPEDDWLRIDAYRGTISAGHFLSNNQVVGYIKISQKRNPKLKDKTNREGLIEEGRALEDFVTLIKIFLEYIRRKPYARYRLDLEKKKSQDVFHNSLVEEELGILKSLFINDKSNYKKISSLEKTYKTEREYLVRRAETTEELAGVGLSVESASHDIMGIMEKVLINLDGLIKDLLSHNEFDKNELLKDLQSVRGGMSFIESQLKDIQLLFKSSKQRRKNIRITTIIEKVERIYRRLLIKENITFKVVESGSPLMAKTTDAILLQLLLNLFDNSIYWLQQISAEDKKIIVTLDGDRGNLIFSDNGPGIETEDQPYIFEPFYSGKGVEGRGLGLYIARQLLERNDYSIDIAGISSETVLEGANFVVNFISGE